MQCVGIPHPTDAFSPAQWRKFCQSGLPFRHATLRSIPKRRVVETALALAPLIHPRYGRPDWFQHVGFPLPFRPAARRLISAIAALWAHEGLRRGLAHPLAHAALRGLRFAGMVAVLAFLAYQLTAIGWAQVIGALPTNPAFYLLFALSYACLPLTEILIYEACWRIPLKAHAWPFFVKRAYNFGVFDMSGEAYFGFWAHQRLKLGLRPVLSAVKDVNLLSGASSNLATPLLLAWFYWAGGEGKQALGLDSHLQGWVFGSVGAIALGTLIAAAFQSRFLSTSPSASLRIFFLHTVRLGLTMLLQAWSWALVFPNTPFSVWLAFVIAQLVLSRIPFVPNRDLLFLGLSLNMAKAVEAPQAAVAGMFVMAAALTQCANFSVLGLHALIRTAKTAPLPRGPGADHA